MSQLTTEQMVKIGIGVFVLLIVVIGVGLFFRENIFGFFTGLGPEQGREIDLTSPYYKSCLEQKNIVAVKEFQGRDITFVGETSADYFISTDGGKIYGYRLGIGWIGFTAGNIVDGQVNIVDSYKQDVKLSKLDGAEYVQGVFCRVP